MSKKSGATKGARPRRDRVKEQPVDLLSVWEEDFKEADKARPEYPVVNVVFAGLPCKARRMNTLDHLNAGSLPIHLASELLAELSGEPSKTDEAPQISPEMFAQLPPDEQARLREEQAKEREKVDQYARAVVCKTIVEPRIVLSTKPGPGEISYGRLFLKRPTFITEVLAWVRNDCPSVSVRATGGETSVKALENFREGGMVPSDSETGSAVWWQTECSRRVIR
jgi:hypothetical protein